MFSNNIQTTAFVDPGFILCGSAGMSVAPRFHSRKFLWNSSCRLKILEIGDAPFKSLGWSQEPETLKKPISGRLNHGAFG